MDWLRRNWPDLAIGIALVAVIAGIIATLLTGGSFFPLGPTQTASTPTSPALAQRAQPQPGLPQAAAPGAEQTTTTPSEAVPASPQPGVAVLAPDGTPADAVAPAAGQPEAAAPPSDPAPAAAAPAPPAPPSPVVAAPAPAATAAAAAPSPAPVTAATGPLPSASADPEAPFRVSVGAFGNPENAARQAEIFRAAGYPVFTGTQGSLTIVLVGPFETEAAAVAVAGQVRGGGFGVDPVIYRFQPDASSAASTTPAPAAPAAAAAPAAPAAPTAPIATAAAAPAPPAAPAEPAPASSASAVGRFLQVGAFGSVQSAQPLRERLASLGFAASEVSEDGMVKLLVGPFDEAGLSGARQRLAEQGIQSFPR
jgi:cell division septation protein DedD